MPDRERTSRPTDPDPRTDPPPHTDPEPRTDPAPLMDPEPLTDPEPPTRRDHPRHRPRGPAYVPPAMPPGPNDTSALPMLPPTRARTNRTLLLLALVVALLGGLVGG